MISDRLREQREALGLSQQALAEQCGITARSQRNYEAGERLPDAEYLASLLELGADVLYILSGKRMESMPAADAAERVLIDNYRRCPSDAKANLLQSSVLLAAGMAAPGTVGMIGKEASVPQRQKKRVEVSAPGGYAAGRDMSVGASTGGKDGEEKDPGAIRPSGRTRHSH